jgi:hypothetical protein
MIESELVAQRNEELTSTFLSMLGSGMTAKEVMASAADSSCSRFWITPQNAMRHVKARLDGTWGSKGNEHPQQIRKIDTIINMCQGDFSMSKVRDVVEGPAPSFFLSEAATRDIVYRTLKKRRDGDTH